MRDDHYGWFEKIEKGVYMLTPKGVEGLQTYAKVTPPLTSEPAPDP